MTKHDKPETTMANLRIGETVVWLGHKYQVVHPGSASRNSELRSTTNPDLIAFVSPNEFPIDLDDSE